MSAVENRHTSQAAMMRNFMLMIGLAAICVTRTTACITVHSDMSNCLLDGDTQLAQAFDNGVEVCSSGETKNFASYDTVYNIPCIDGYSLTVTHNSQQATITTPNGYTATMNADQSQSTQFTCAQVGDDNEFKGLEFESCMTDNFGNCNEYPNCGLCDYRGRCN